jgi:sulfur transfer complex TusBCD TusB component (DsrH family)
MATSLHLLMSADPRAVADCVAFARAGDAIVLVDRGVDLLAYWTGHPAEPLNALDNVSLAALEADVLATGLARRAAELEMALWSDAQWVEQVCSAGRALSWK